MNSELLDALVAWVDGLDVNQIFAALMSMKNVNALRDPPTIAKFLWARSNGLV